MNKTKILCLVGLTLFVISYIMFSQGGEFIYSQKPIDFAHWMNLIGGALLINFNNVFPKNKINSVASFLTTLGVIGNIGLCALDLLMWSYGMDFEGRAELGNQISKTPSIFYPFQVFGPSLLLIGLSLHAWNFIRGKPLISLLAILGAPFIGISFFILKNGMLMAVSCFLFALGLGLLLFQPENKSFEEKSESTKSNK
ncbi:hypothetical protein LXD69_11605 [Flavobacterium sediminilitoris]|uniref:Uncharacterized protein n=1 Tax=Flavobacterium sediminilitoris TaxID=2024526 RepID=A0ABY4HK40_9FLAO|nr:MULTISPECIES: hypothetical protein [Flavobacterium]UOX32686.1 hypothetical protein LXD69_11605 [Flavobacterium sediminilitoris]